MAAHHCTSVQTEPHKPRFTAGICRCFPNSARQLTGEGVCVAAFRRPCGKEAPGGHQQGTKSGGAALPFAHIPKPR